MTDDELTAIRAMLDETEHARERLHGLMGPSDRPRAPVLQAAIDLLAEVERLRAENRDLIAVADSLVVSPSAKPVLGDYRAALAAMRAENAALREIVQAVASARWGIYPSGEHLFDIGDALELKTQAIAVLARNDERSQQS